MAVTFKWVAVSSIGNQLTTELNSLGNGSYSSASAAYDNTSNLYQWFAFDVTLASLNPTAGCYLQIFAPMSLDGTTYEDVPSSTNTAFHMAYTICSLTTGSAAKRVMTAPFKLLAAKYKFVMLNKAGVALGASGNTAGLYGAYEQGV